MILPQEEFSFTDSINRLIGKKTFKVNYGIHPREVMEPRDLPNDFKMNAQSEKFSTRIKQIHDQVRDTLNQNTTRYKQQEDKKKKHVSFKGGDQVWAYLNKKRLPRGHTKLQMRKIGPYHILHKFIENASEISFPMNT